MKFDVAIVGGGPGGTSCAIALAQRGLKAVIIEKDSFPRYHIGESMTGECGATIREFGLEAVMVERGYPVKHGVRVFNPSGAFAFWVPVMARDPETGLRPATTWQVPRDDFDALMLAKAQQEGTAYVKGEAIGLMQDDDGRARGVRVKGEDGSVFEIAADAVVDASGPTAFLSHLGVLPKKSRGRYDNQVAVFSQVTGAVRDPGESSGNTLIFYKEPNHWAWFIPLDAERTSIGAVVPTGYFKSQGLSAHDFLMREMEMLNPNLTERMANVRYVEDVRTASNYSYEIAEFTGPGYLCVGDSHRFIDPVFSFGMHFAVKEGQLAAGAIADYLSGAAADSERPFAQYQRTCQIGMNSIQDLIDAFWTRPLQFAYVAHYQHRDDIIDLFAGRVYEEEPSAGLQAIREVVRQAGLEPSPPSAQVA